MTPVPSCCTQIGWVLAPKHLRSHCTCCTGLFVWGSSCLCLLRQAAKPARYPELKCRSVAPRSFDWTWDRRIGVGRETRIAGTWSWRRSTVGSWAVCGDVPDGWRTRPGRELRLVWFFGLAPLWCRRRGIGCGRRRARGLRVARRWRWCGSGAVCASGGCLARIQCRFLRRRNLDLQEKRIVESRVLADGEDSGLFIFFKCKWKSFKPRITFSRFS